MPITIFDSFRQRLPAAQRSVLDELARKMAAISHRRPPGSPLENWWRWIHQASNSRLTQEQCQALALYALLAGDGSVKPTGMPRMGDGSVRTGLGGRVDRGDPAGDPSQAEQLALQQFMEHRSQLEQMLSNLMKAQSDAVAALARNLR